MKTAPEDRWLEIAEQYYASRYSDNHLVWSELYDEAWDLVMKNIRQVFSYDLGPQEAYTIRFEWSGPEFATMDGGDYHWGDNTFASDDLGDILSFLVCQMETYHRERYQSVFVVITQPDGSTIETSLTQYRSNKEATR